MPPFNDIYIVTDNRSKACIDKFLSCYADLRIDKERNDFAVLVDGEGIETGTLAATIDYGLSNAQKSFAVYFASRIDRLESIMLFFTPDGKLVFGLSTEYDADSDEEAERVLAMLKIEFETDLGVITCEMPPGDAYDRINGNLEQL